MQIDFTKNEDGTINIHLNNTNADELLALVETAADILLEEPTS